MLPKTYRLTKEKDFKLIFRKGRYYKGDFINLKKIKNNLEKSRFGLVLGLKISKKAVVRNKLKRQITEVLRLNLKQIKPGFDLVILPQSDIVGKKYQEIKDSLMQLLKKSKTLND